jgi:TolB-like protein
VPNSQVRLGEVIFDPIRGELHDHAGSEIRLRPKALEFLLVLARNPGRLLSKDELFESVWPNVVVTEDSITQCVREIRRAIRDSDGKFLRTVTKRGYRLDVEKALAEKLRSPSGGPSRVERERPSLVVLPFQSFPTSPDNEWFADGVVEDITTALSRFRSLFVIARNSAFTFKGQPIDVREVGHRLGVRYVLEGSVRSADQHLRITGQLIEAETGRHVWADQFDGNRAEVFDLQDRITAAVAGTLAPRIQRAEIERATQRSTNNRSAYELYLQAILKFYDRTVDGYSVAKGSLEEAVARDPGFAQAQSMLARLLELGLFAGWETDVEANTARAISFAREALSVDSTDPLVLARSGQVLTMLGGMHAEGSSLLKRAIATNPNCAEAYAQGAWVSIWNGDFADALTRADVSEQLDPLSLEGVNRLNIRASAYFFLRDFTLSIQSSERAIARAPDYSSARRYLIIALTELGRDEEARMQVKELLKRDSTSTLSRSKAHSLFKHDWMIKLYIDALRRAGLPPG